MKTSLALLGCTGLLAASSACSGCDGDGNNVDTNVGGSGTATNVGGAGGILFNTGGSGQGGDGGSCAQQSAEAMFVSQPIDIIFVIDNSGSMTAEINEVEYQINANFAAIIDGAMPPVDYRIVMVSNFGNSNSQDVCISAPLSGIPDNNNDGHCDSIPNAPVNGPRFFHHSGNSDAWISSFNSLCRLIEQYNTGDAYGLQPGGYQDVLRPNSFKFFVEITDDDVSTSQANGCNSVYNDQNTVAGGQAAAAQFDSDLLALSPMHFGADPANRNYSFWSINGAAPYNSTAMKPYGDPAPPDIMIAPIVTTECQAHPQCSGTWCGADGPGTGYQALAILTGGYRYPSCDIDYTEIFQLMAQGVIAGAQVPCEFDVPPDPPEGMIDTSTVEVDYSSMGSPVATYTQVATAADCMADSFYIDTSVNPNKIVLCPATCTEVQSDPDAKLDIRYDCVNDVQ